MSILLEIDGKYLKSAYSVYIIEIINNASKYYYIGQTGDSNYVTSRSPLRRLIGHLSDVKSSTENQIYKAIVKILIQKENIDLKSYTREEKELIENFFVSSIIRMYSFPLFEFKYDETKENHRNIRREVLEFEKQIIDVFSKSSLMVLNNKIPKKVNSNIKFVAEFDEIKKTFEV